jgi:hypothetical protein
MKKLCAPVLIAFHWSALTSCQALAQDLKTPDWQARASVQKKVAGHGNQVQTDTTRVRNSMELASMVVGAPAENVGKTFYWDRKEKEILLAAFLNARDDLGVAIANVKKGDTLAITSASGIASFDGKNGELVSSFIAVVATAAADVATNRTSAGVIKQLTITADSQFGSGGTHKRRDAFGRDPGGEKQYEKNEGGVLVCLPEAGGIYYSDLGKIKEKAERSDAIRPAHVKHGFFLRPNNPEHNRRHLTADGDLHLLVWDSKFEDNQGYYRVMVKLIRGD